MMKRVVHGRWGAVAYALLEDNRWIPVPVGSVLAIPICNRDRVN